MVKSLYDKPSLLTRVAVGKAIGLLFGIIGFFALPSIWPEADPMLRWGILFWYTTVGAVVGIFGVFNYHPVLMLPLPWWVRAPIIGGWMNFVLTFFAHDAMQKAIVAFLGRPLSPFLFVVEGAAIGLVIGGFATWLGGEGHAAAEVIIDE
jgi:hypothetical protein